MVELYGEPYRHFEQRACGHEFDRRGLEKAARKKGFISRQFLAPDLLPKNVGTFGEKEIGREQACVLEYRQRG